MATEVNQNYFAWTQEEPSVQDSSQGTPQVFDHGSISFGRFELESLAWEKWSVFTNDRRHEEFGKFNGLVAKKKAYFEEYFKRIRELKALQQQNQQTELNLEYSGDGSDSSQTGEDEPAAEHGSPAGSGVHLHSMEQAEAQTIFEHDLEYYDDHENERLINDISSSVGGMHQIGQEIREDASCDNFSGKMDVLQQSTNSGQDGPVMLLQSMMTPKRTIEKDSPIDQATKIIPKNAKMTSSNIPDHAGFNKGPDSGKPHAMNHKFKQENIQSTRRLQPAAGFIGTTGRTRLVANPAPSIIGVRRPSSPAPQRPSTRERRPVTRDSSRKPLGVATPCRPSTAERRPATKELAPKQGNIALPRRPSTPDRRPMTKELAPMHANTGTPRRPSTAERRPINRQMAPMQVSIATPRRPSTAERRPVARETARKHADVISLRRPSTAERRPITTETVRKHADVITLCQPSTSERRSVSREIAPKLAHVTPPRRPSTSERRPATRETALNHYNVPSSCRPSTPERHTRGSALLHANIVRTPQRPSTGERRPISTESICKLDAKAPIRSRATPANPKGAISTKVITKKAPTPKLIRSSKAEIKSCANERMKRQVDGKQKSSSVNLPPGKMLTPIIRANQVLESFRKPNKESIKETMQSRVSASKTVTPLQTGSMMARAPNPPPPPPPPRRPSQASNKPNTNNSPPPPRRPSQASNKPNASNPPPPPRRPSQALNVPTANNLSVGVRKHKASGPHWH